MKFKFAMRAKAGALAVLLAWSAAAVAQAPAAPGATIRLVVPAAPGGSTDILARNLGRIIQEQTGTAIIVDNKAGAGGAIGAAAVARAAPDGLTVLMTVPDAITVLPSLRKDLPYNVDRDLVPIALVAETSWVFAVNAKSPAKTIQDLLRMAASRRGGFTFASPGIGTSAHLITEMLAQKANVQMLHVPYKGGGPATTALVGGEVELLATSPIGVKGMVDSGQLRALVMTGGMRSSVMPDVPTLAESGFPGFVASAWYGLFAPAGLSPARAERLEEMVQAAARSPTFLKQLEQMGLESRYMGHGDFTQFLVADSARWRDVIANARNKLTD